MNCNVQKFDEGESPNNKSQSVVFASLQGNVFFCQFCD